MSERYDEPALPGFSEIEIMETMGAESLVDHILAMSDKAANLETKMNEASQVLEGAYGLSIEDVLLSREIHPSLFDEKEKQNGESA